jgi:hypothetical protein
MAAQGKGMVGNLGPDGRELDYTSGRPPATILILYSSLPFSKIASKV